MDSRHIDFGSHILIGRQDEDRGMCFPHHKRDACPNMSSFGIFDGHNGSSTSSICSQVFNRTVAQRIHALQTTLKTALSEEASHKNRLPKDIELDLIVCESLRSTCVDVDEAVKKADGMSGSTANCLFIHRDESTGCSRVYCSNIGDSRCVMFRANHPHHTLPTSSSPTLQRSYGSSGGLADSVHDDTLPRIALVRGLSSPVSIIPMSEDHKVYCLRERSRIENKLPLTWNPLPISLSPQPAPCTLSSLSLSSPPQQSMFEVAEYKNEDSNQQMAAVNELLTQLKRETVFPSLLPFHLPVYPPSKRKVDSPKEDLRKLDSVSPSAEHDCFIARRSNSKGEAIGPEAVHGGPLNLSLTMTRSIGDRYGPPVCVPVPEITAVTIEPGQFVRFVLASDGVWDALNNEAIAQIVFKRTTPDSAAQYIALQAEATRKSLGLRRDDISVIVVDVNPSCRQLYSDALSGCSCILS